MQSEIHAADVRKISQEFAKNGIQTDFKGNKVVAWCSLMCYQIIKGLNTNYGLKLGLPNGIFLDMFMHEFAHVIHEENAINKLGGKKFVEDTNNALIPFNLSTFQKEYKHLLGSICNYAQYSPFEAVACDLTKRTVAGIDKNSLKVQSNFIKKSPYENKAFLLNLFDFEAKDEQFRLLHRFWNGKLI